MIHLLGERLARKAGFAVTQVPYKGVPLVLQDLIGGQIDITFVLQSAVRDLASTGKVKVLRLHKALTAACHEPQFQAQTATSGSDPAPPMSLMELERFFDDETRLYHAMARDIGIQPE